VVRYARGYFFLGRPFPISARRAGAGDPEQRHEERKRRDPAQGCVGSGDGSRRPSVRRPGARRGPTAAARRASDGGAPRTRRRLGLHSARNRRDCSRDDRDGDARDGRRAGRVCSSRPGARSGRDTGRCRGAGRTCSSEDGGERGESARKSAHLGPGANGAATTGRAPLGAAARGDITSTPGDSPPGADCEETRPSSRSSCHSHIPGRVVSGFGRAVSTHLEAGDRVRVEIGTDPGGEVTGLRSAGTCAGFEPHSRHAAEPHSDLCAASR
jgi:hypothetical protein